MIKFKLLRIGAKLPTRAYEGDSGMDLYACCEPFNIRCGETKLVPIGIAVELPEGYEAQIRPRSSVAKLGILTHFGTIDNGYRGELGVRITNTNPALSYDVTNGIKIAQLIVAPICSFPIVEVKDFSNETQRGERGYGSSGR